MLQPLGEHAIGDAIAALAEDGFVVLACRQERSTLEEAFRGRSAGAARVSAFAAAVGEAGKLPAFVRRDVLIALSHRRAFLRDVAMLVPQLVVFWLVGPARRPGDAARLRGHAGELRRVRRDRDRAQPGGRPPAGEGRHRGPARAAARDAGDGPGDALGAADGTAGGVALDLLWLPLRMALFLTAAAVGLGLDFEWRARRWCACC